MKSSSVHGDLISALSNNKHGQQNFFFFVFYTPLTTCSSYSFVLKWRLNPLLLQLIKLLNFGTGLSLESILCFTSKSNSLNGLYLSFSISHSHISLQLMIFIFTMLHNTITTTHSKTPSETEILYGPSK